MKPFLAIVEDTWRQSKQQVVFLILLVLMLLMAAAFIALPKVFTTDEGTEILGLAWQERPQAGLEQTWDAAYRQAVARDLGFEKQLEAPQEKLTEAQRELRRRALELERLRAKGASDAEMSSALAEAEKSRAAAEKKTAELREELDRLRDQAQALVDARASGITPLRKGVEVWLSSAAGFLFVLGMWGFVAASAGYFPGMLAAGAVDVLVSKPVWRYQIFLGKYAGGLVLYTAALLVTYLLVFAGVGIRTGVWHLQFLGGMPLTIFSVALLYAIVVLIGVLTRSTALSMIIGYVFYFVIDSLVALVQRLGDLPIADSVEWLEQVSTWSKRLFPGFGRLQAAVEASVVNVPVFESQALVVGLGWLVVCLALAYERFRRIDF